MVALENATVYGSRKYSFFVVGSKYFKVFRTYNYVDRFFLFETVVDAFENGVAEFDFVIFYHYARENIRFPDKVGDESVCRFVVNLFRRGNLLNFAASHNNDLVAHGKSFFLVMRNVNKGNAEIFMHVFEFELHIFSHFKIESAKRFVEQ